MVNYENSFIYKLCCKDPEITDVYVGSTTNLARRKCKHKSDCENGTDRLVYSFIREHGGFKNWDMVVIEEYSCQTKLELHQRERYWLEALQAALNKYIPSRPVKEYKKEYYETNKDDILEKCREYYGTNKDAILEKRREYYETNKDTITEKKREYYEKNKDALAEKQRLKQVCEVCGCSVTKGNFQRHLKSRKHQDNLLL